MRYTKTTFGTGWKPITKEDLEILIGLRAKESCYPVRILKSGNRTIVFWTDGTKTIVKRPEDTADNDYEAFTAALAIKVFGTNSALKRIIKNKTVEQKPKKKKEAHCDACDIDALLKKLETED
jgi:hypothetical protein